MTVTQATTVSDELVAAFARLIPQLSSSARAPTRAELEEIVASPATTILLAENDEGAIIGSLTLVVFQAPTGGRAWIEDVVVLDLESADATTQAVDMLRRDHAELPIVVISSGSTNFVDGLAPSALNASRYWSAIVFWSTCEAAR